MASAQGTIAGCVRDTHRGRLPGVEVIASGQTSQTRVVTDGSGCFELDGLPVGSYSVRATLAGFVPAVRENVVVVDGRATGAVDFELCLSALEDISWVVPGFDQMWEMSDVVALVEIDGTGPVQSECPSRDFEHTATVLELLKDRTQSPVGRTLKFIQTNWSGERVAYPRGSRMVVFLSGAGGVFSRAAGPYSVFLLNGDRITSPMRSVPEQPLTEFLATLRGRSRKRHPADGAQSMLNATSQGTKRHRGKLRAGHAGLPSFERPRPGRTREDRRPEGDPSAGDEYLPHPQLSHQVDGVHATVDGFPDAAEHRHDADESEATEQQRQDALEDSRAERLVLDGPEREERQYRRG